MMSDDVKPAVLPTEDELSVNGLSPTDNSTTDNGIAQGESFGTEVSSSEQASQTEAALPDSSSTPLFQQSNPEVVEQNEASLAGTVIQPDSSVESTPQDSFGGNIEASLPESETQEDVPYDSPEPNNAFPAQDEGVVDETAPITAEVPEEVMNQAVTAAQTIIGVEGDSEHQSADSSL